MCPAVIHLAAFWEYNNESENGENYEDSDSENDLRFDGVDNYAMFDGTSIECGDNTQRQQQRRMNNDESSTKNKGMSRFTATKDVAIALLALFAMVSGAYASLVDIFQSYGFSKEHTINSTIGIITTTTIGPGPESAYRLVQ